MMMTRMVLMRFLVILFGISIFVLTLEVITYVDNILELNDRQLSSLAQYAWLRLPSVLADRKSVV